MGNSALFKQLKELVHDFYSDGEILDKPIGRIGKKELPDNIVRFLGDFVDLLLNSRMVCEETKIYISDVYITHEGIITEMESRGLGRPNKNTVQTKLWNDKGKIIKAFGEGMILELVEYRDISKLNQYRDSLNMVRAKYSKARLLSNIALKLPDTSNVKVTDVDKESFEEFISIVAPYCKKHMAFISEQIPTNIVSYCKYILSSKDITEEDIENRNMLLEILTD